MPEIVLTIAKRRNATERRHERPGRGRILAEQIVHGGTMTPGKVP